MPSTSRGRGSSATSMRWRNVLSSPMARSPLRSSFVALRVESDGLVVYLLTAGEGGDSANCSTCSRVTSMSNRQDRRRFYGTPSVEAARTPLPRTAAAKMTALPYGRNKLRPSRMSVKTCFDKLSQVGCEDVQVKLSARICRRSLTRRSAP